MTHITGKLLPLVLVLVAAVITPLLLSENAAAQDVDTHPSDLFEPPQEGIETASARDINMNRDLSYLLEEPQDGTEFALPRSSRQAESWRDYTHLSLRTSITSESNIFLDNSENEQSDTIFTIAPTLSVSSPSLFGEDSTISEYVRPRLSVSYTPSYRIYSNNSDLNGLDHNFRFNFNTDSALQIKLPKTTISFDLDYDQSQSADRRNGGFVGRDSLSAGARVSHSLTGKTSLNFSATARSDSYDNSDNRNAGNSGQGLLDDVTYNFRASMMYQLTGKISVGPYVGYGISDVSGGSAGGVENTQDRHSYSAGITGTYNATGKTVFTGSLGWTKYEFDGPSAGSGDDSLTWRFGLSHQLGPRTSLRATLWQDYKPSNSVGNTSYLATGASLALSWRQSDRWTHSLSATFENDDFFSGDTAGDSGSSDYFSLGLTSNCRFNNGLSVGASLRSSTQNNNNTNDQALNDFENWIFSIYANYIFW